MTYRPRYEVKPWSELYSTKLWKGLRAHQLNTHPLCAYCMKRGKATPATVVDHIEPHRGDPGRFKDPNNLQSMCKLCHDSAKAKEENIGKTIGCDEDGTPNDPQHHWCREGEG